MCRDETTFVGDGQYINNWTEGGLWSRIKGKMVFVSLTPKGTQVSTWNGRQCLKASLRADVWMCWKSGAPTPSKPGHVYGYGVLEAYTTGLLSDDLYIDMVEVWNPEAGAREVKAHMLEAVAREGVDTLAKRAAFSQSFQRLEPEIGKVEAYRIAALHGINPDEVVKTSVIEVAKAKAERRVQLSSDKFLRLEAVATSLESLGKNAWVLPSLSPCGREPPGDNEFERKTALGQKARLSKELTTRLYSVGLGVERPEGKAGEYNFSAKKLPVILKAKGDVSLSGVAPIRGETYMQDVCCNLAGECRSADGWFSKSCQPLEVLRKRPVSAGASFDADAMVKKMSLSVEPDVAKDLAENFGGVSGSAVVRVKNVVRICEDGRESSSVMLVDIVGMRVSSGTSVLYEMVQFDVPVEEAVEGPDAWVEKKLGGAQKK